MKTIDVLPPQVSRAAAHRHPLDAFFEPKSVALIGATEKEGSVGRTILWNLISSPFGGTVYPINPKRPNVLGIRAYPKLADLPEPADLAVIVTPPATAPDLIRECAAAGTKNVIIISAGFKELGPEGLALEGRVLEAARAGGVRVIGPNCLGVMGPMSGLNATFASSMARRGNVGFISQSGALCTAVLDWSHKELVGFSHFISIGSMVDVGWGDLIDYLGNDPRATSIVIYMESVGDARSFLSAAREVALIKPIIVIKAGRSEAAAKAAASHTGSLAGSDEALDAAFRRCGVLRVNSIAELFYMAEVLSKQPCPKGPRLTIVTNAGGPGVLATDALMAAGGKLAELNPATIEALNPVLPATWSHNNPVDIIGDAAPERYAKALEIVAKDPNSDGMLVILTPQAMTDPTKTAEELIRFAKLGDKPLLASWMGGPDVAAGEAILNAANIPTFPYPDTACRAYEYMWQYSDGLAHLYETPALLTDEENGGRLDRAAAKKLIAAATKAGRTLLTEAEAKDLLKAYGIPVTETRVARTVEEAVAAAEAMKYPVVLKLHSLTLTHKTDVGGVQLNLANAAAVRKAYAAIEEGVTTKAGAEHFQGVSVQPFVRHEGYELIVGSTLDSQFGPVVLFGTGGQLVEVFRDRALGLPPFTETLARQMIERTKIAKALQGVRGRKAVDWKALEVVLVRFGQMVAEQRRIKEVDINPLMASPDGIIALDARVVLHSNTVKDEQIPPPAIRPYPVEYRWSFTMPDGRAMVMRPIRPEDEPALVRFHAKLGERSVYLRYFSNLPLSQRVTHERLRRICFVDYDRQMVLVADHKDPATGEHDLCGVARLNRIPGTTTAEFALVVCDKCQGCGLGSALFTRLIEVARAEKIRRLVADVLTENTAMLRVCEEHGLTLKPTGDATLVRAELTL